ncbi:hypothetical protein Dda_0458 [Drechslerella dactyloides]|uniref:Uncharacterized protein n=1 Tax=Drechslerella dactyloides TaxID=74499 RepID=A0AAD6J4A6_DREDA|nr:hypothetical protein Dda_0458 [Drechslerella dactyloides]
MGGLEGEVGGDDGGGDDDDDGGDDGGWRRGKGASEREKGAQKVRCCGGRVINKMQCAAIKYKNKMPPGPPPPSLPSAALRQASRPRRSPTTHDLERTSESRCERMPSCARLGWIMLLTGLRSPAVSCRRDARCFDGAMPLPLPSCSVPQQPSRLRDALGPGE